MNSPVTIDASVFVSAFLPRESAHQASRELMLSIHRQSIPIIVPWLVLPEISTALARGHGKPEAAIAFVRELKNLLSVTFVDLDENLADLAADIAANNSLRGSDAVYGAVALRYGTELITLDKEQLDRLPKLVNVRTPH